MQNKGLSTLPSPHLKMQEYTITQSRVHNKMIAAHGTVFIVVMVKIATKKDGILEYTKWERVYANTLTNEVLKKTGERLYEELKKNYKLK